MKTSISLSNPFDSISTWILLVSVFLHEFQIARSIPIKDQLKLPEGQNYSVSDLLRLMDELVVDSSPKDLEHIFKRFQSSQKSSPRSFGRQITGPQAFYDDRPGRPILDPLGVGFYQLDGPTGYGGTYDPPGPVASGLVEALTSISQYDDLRCVPRLLCEIATGSKPGNGDYKASTLEDFGKNTLIGLLTAYNFEAASPVLAFGKAALLGYTSSGDSSICYKEYRKCPRDPRDLVYYLNNHNGGFFRFFKESRRGATVVQGSNRMGFALKEPAPPPGLSGPESDRTGTGELRFDNPEPSARQDEEKNLLRFADDGSSKVVFPEDDKTEESEDDGRPSSSRISKSLKPTVSVGFFPASSSSTLSSFFPSEDEDLIRTNVVFERFEDSRHQDFYSGFRTGRLLLPDYEADHKTGFSSLIRFPDQVEGFQNFGTGSSGIFPDEY